MYELNILTLFNCSRISAGSLPGCVAPFFFLLFLFSRVPLLPSRLSFSPNIHPVLSTAGDVRENCIVFVCLVTVTSQYSYNCQHSTHTSASDTHRNRSWSSEEFSSFFFSLATLPISSSSSSYMGLWKLMIFCCIPGHGLVSYSANAFSSAVFLKSFLSLTEIMAGCSEALFAIICWRQVATSTQYSLNWQQHASACGCICMA